MEGEATPLRPTSCEAAGATDIEVYYYQTGNHEVDFVSRRARVEVCRPTSARGGREEEVRSIERAARRCSAAGSR